MRRNAVSVKGRLFRGMVVSFSFEIFLKHLFGVEYHGYTGEQSLTTWRKDMAKIVRTLRRSVALNVASDRHHLESMEKMCSEAEQSIKKAKSIDQTTELTIHALVKLNLMLLGQMPNHYDTKHPYQAEHWMLHGERSIGYTQSHAQRVQMILARAHEGYFGPGLKEAQLRVSLHRLGDSERFIEWFRRKHPNEYLKLF